jgi:2-iminobutanoate/2-iminopropanoate deaminase
MQPHHIDAAPKAIGPYCHAMQTGNLVYCSGQTPIDPATMQLVEGDIAAQTAQALHNLQTVLAGLGLTLKNVVKTNVYLKNMDDFQGMNFVYASMFGEHCPARTTVAVKQNPLDALVEIECIAEIPRG